MVSSLIDEDTRWWKVNIIHSLFLPSKVEAILRIPLSLTLPEDKLIWTRNKKATFIVRSAYYIAANMVTTNMEGECSSSTPDSNLWRKIWRLQFPQKLEFLRGALAWMLFPPYLIFANGVWILVAFAPSMIRSWNRLLMPSCTAVTRSTHGAADIATPQTPLPYLRTSRTLHLSSLIKAHLKI